MVDSFDHSVFGPLIAHAGAGNVDAQAAMLDHMVLEALKVENPAIVYLSAIELMAHLLASHGRPEDRVRLAGVLVFRGSLLLLSGRTDEGRQSVRLGLRHLAVLAADGNEIAGPLGYELSRLVDSGLSVPASIMLSLNTAQPH